MDLNPNSSQFEISTADPPITTSTFGPHPVNLPLAIALPICLFVFLAFLIIITICLVRKKKCSQKPVEPPLSRGSVEGCSDNGDNNNNIDGETNNHQTRGITTDEEILEVVSAKPDVCDASPEEQRIIRARTPEESLSLQVKHQDDTESTAGSIVEGEENPMPEECEVEASDVVMETAAVAPPLGQQSQRQDTSTESSAAEDQDDFQTYIAVYSFEAEHENQMSLEPNDIVQVAETEEHEGWLCGWKRNSSVKGWFPKSHVRQVEQPPSETIGSKLSDSAEPEDEFDDDVRESRTCCRALYDYYGTEKGELSFKAGDSLVVHHEVTGTGWLYGQRGDEVGWFPTTYVEVIPGLNPLKSTTSDSTATTTHDETEAAQKTDEQKQVVIAPADIILEGSQISSSINSEHSPKTPLSRNVLNKNKDDAKPPSVKSKRPSISSGKPISDRLGLSKIVNFRTRRNSKDEPVTLKEVVLVPNPALPRNNLCEDASSATQQKQSKSAGKKSRRDPSRPEVPPPQAPRRQSLFKHNDRRKEKIEQSSSINGNQPSLDKTNTLLDKTVNPLTDTVTTADIYDSIEPTEDTERTEDSGESGRVEVFEPKPLQSKADSTRRQWDIALESFDRILEESSDFYEDTIPIKSTNLFPSLSNGLSGSKEKTPDHRDYSTPPMTLPDAVNAVGPVGASLQLTSPQVVNRKTSDDERFVDADGDEVSQKSEFSLLSFAPPGFNDSEEVLTPKFLSYLSQVGSVDKTRLSQVNDTITPLRCQPSMHPPLPPKPSWPPASDHKVEEHSEEGDVSRDLNDGGTLTFIVQKGRSKRQSLSTLLLPDVVRGYITNDEYNNLQIPPPAGFSSDFESVEDTNHASLVSLESLDSVNSLCEIQTPRYFGRRMYGPQEADSNDDSSVHTDAKQKVCERVHASIEDLTDTVVWKPWEHLKPTISRNSYSENDETRQDSFRSRHDSRRHGVMFKLADGSVVFDESDVGLESVI